MLPENSVEQTSLPAAEFFPDGQDVHVSDDRAPNAGENVSAGHFVHEASDAAAHEDEYLPASHFMQSEAPSIEYLPAAQSEHVAADVAPTDSE